MHLGEVVRGKVILPTYIPKNEYNGNLIPALKVAMLTTTHHYL
jgi:hypothetical protein